MFYPFIFLLSSTVSAQTPKCEAVDRDDPLNVYLVTSGPGSGMYTRVGHSALWVSGAGKDEVFFNWGAYDLEQNNFLWHFFMGTAHFKLSLMPKERNDSIAEREERVVKAQHLNLSPDMLQRLERKLEKKAKPQNRSYIYHWEKQNCATLIRDMLDSAAGLPWQELKNEHTNITRRNEVLRHLGPLHWGWFGWHFMGSAYADQTYTQWELMHIPENLMKQAAETTIQWEDGSKHPLVDYECILRDSSRGWALEEPPTRWHWLWTIGLFFSGLIFKGLQHPSRFISSISKSILSAHFLFGAFLGTIFPFFWITSSLEGYGPNENWFYANPLSFFLAVTVWKINFASKPSILLSTTLVFLGMISNFFTNQINIDFIGFFGFPILSFCLFLYLPKKGDQKMSF